MTSYCYLVHGILEQKGGRSSWPGFFLTPGKGSLMQPLAHPGHELAFNPVCPPRQFCLLGHGWYWNKLCSQLYPWSYLPGKTMLTTFWISTLLFRDYKVISPSACTSGLCSLEDCLPHKSMVPFLYPDPL